MSKTDIFPNFLLLNIMQIIDLMILNNLKKN